MLERKAKWNTAWAPLCVMTLVWQLCPQPAGDLGDWASPFCASMSFSDNHHLTDFIWYSAHSENHNLLVESTDPVYYSFFPSSSKYPIANYKAERDVFTPVKAAISPCLSYQSEDETTRNQATEFNLQGGWVGKRLPHSHPHSRPTGQGPNVPSLHS